MISLNFGRDDARRIVRGYSRHLQERVVTRAGVRAINKTAVTATAALARRIREDYSGLKIADIKKSIALTRAKPAKKLDQAQAVITVKRDPIPLAKFAPKVKRVRTARGRRLGVTVRVKKQRKLVTGGFLLVRNGVQMIFRRVGRSRLPIEKIPGVSVLGIVTKTKVIVEIRRLIRQRLAVTLRQELGFEALKSQKGRGQG